MYRKSMWVTAVALYLVSMHTFAVQDFSVMSTTELTKFKLEEMGDEDLKAFRAEVQKRSVSTKIPEQESSRDKKQDQKKGQGGGKGKGGMQSAMGRGH